MVQESTPLVNAIGGRNHDVCHNMLISRSDLGGRGGRWWPWVCRRIVRLPRNFLNNRKLLLLCGIAFVIFIIYIIITVDPPISRNIKKIWSYGNVFQKFQVNVDRKPVNPRLTWPGGGEMGDIQKVTVPTLRSTQDPLGDDFTDPAILDPSFIIKKPSAYKQVDAPYILLLSKAKTSSLLRSLVELFVANKFHYIHEVLSFGDIITSLGSSPSAPPLLNYRCVVFDDFRHYLSLASDARALLDSYLLQHRVGLVAFVSSVSPVKGSNEEQLIGYPLLLTNKINVQNFRLLPNSTAGVYHMLRPNASATADAPVTVAELRPQHPALLPLVLATPLADQASSNWSSEAVATSVVDVGAVDGIRRVLLGGSASLWLHRLLLLDALAYTGGEPMTVTLERRMLVDVDDIFVARLGIRMKEADVKAMMEAQLRLRQLVPGFTFNLGFSGYYFMSGTVEENRGDQALVGNASAFWWFGHMWRHTQPHKLESTAELRQQMMLNRHFARTYNITANTGYSVAPHHSGVYPVHTQLYDAWKRVWGVRVTSTEEYPHLRPDRLRRGFLHRGIMVLPRQMCGLFTHTILFDSPEHPNLRAKLDASIQGGELFQTIAFNPITVFMTHMTNYGNDRLALYVFEKVVAEVQRLTTLRLSTEPPLQLALRYFRMYPGEAEPLWGNPCLDKRHLDIWSGNKSCSPLPDFLVLGPQKTGTTALYTFLGLHPDVLHNEPSPDTFEEVQFFSGNNYFRGLDWYLKAFPQRGTGQLVFEKSATYFDSEAAPRRVRALLPGAKLVVLLLPPEKRAYSWYQHQVSHGVPAAVQHSFSEVLRAADPDTNATKALLNLRSRCLHPGEYALHLQRWLQEFPADQLHVVDGEQLKTDPPAVMQQLQVFLGVTTVLDYTQLLRFNPRKGFYCQVTKNGGSTKCLGKSKGKKYPPMLPEDDTYLKEYYAPHNDQLSQLLQRVGVQLPAWLREPSLPTAGEERIVDRDGEVGEGF